jgi:hypothetical protein
MTPEERAQREEIMGRLQQTRAEISRLLEPPAREADPDGEHPAPNGAAGAFPRSRTMRALMSGRGIGAIGAMAGGLLLARPRLAWRLIRLLPTGAVTRAVMARVIGGWRGRR